MFSSSFKVLLKYIKLLFREPHFKNDFLSHSLKYKVLIGWYHKWIVSIIVTSCQSKILNQNICSIVNSSNTCCSISKLLSACDWLNNWKYCRVMMTVEKKTKIDSIEGMEKIVWFLARRNGSVHEGCRPWFGQFLNCRN